MRFTALTLIAALLLPATAYAEDDMPLAKNSPAPFTGILVPPDNYAQGIKDLAELKKQRVRVTELEGLLKARQEESEAWQAQAVEAAKRTWWDENKFQVGIGLGIITTLVVTYAVVQTVK